MDLYYDLLKPSYADLPEEILFEVFLLLPIYAIIRCQNVSFSWRRTAESEQLYDAYDIGNPDKWMLPGGRRSWDYLLAEEEDSSEESTSADGSSEGDDEDDMSLEAYMGSDEDASSEEWHFPSSSSSSSLGSDPHPFGGDSTDMSDDGW